MCDGGEARNYAGLGTSCFVARRLRPHGKFRDTKLHVSVSRNRFRNQTPVHETLVLTGQTVRVKR